MIDLTLSPTQTNIRTHAHTFASNHLKDAHTLYSNLPTLQARFSAIKPLYEHAVQTGLILAQVPTKYNGAGYSLIDMALLTEELYTADVNVALTTLATGLGLSPLLIAGTEAQKSRFLGPFTGSKGAPLASLVHSEPGGTANYGVTGLRTTARRVEDGWVINGEKLWATNCVGWDDRGADIQCVTCRCEDAPYASAGAKGQTMILLVTREDVAANSPDAYEVLSHPETIGHRAVSGPHIRFREFVAREVIAMPGAGAEVIEAAFTASAALVGAMAVAIMRRCFELTLRFAKSDTRNGTEAIINKQSVADLLIKMKGRCEASRALTWKACATLERLPEAAEIAQLTKVFCSDNAVQCVVEGMNAVGIQAYQITSQYGALLNDAVCLPIFDGGNVGVRRRQIEGIFKSAGYEPWASTFGSKL
ncbi:acyl-CoA dehydrogenase family protein [Aspergillus alliaceus]|uniref:acyl-CoA dehydrogenase family protein n=1 Tax=Petromyces alliaceus TaxID=209559 RepID=UPI0012A3D8F7|nr:acyl-CoA dehydrogenase/oxidase [Aspergillus alliaceus]KAB8226993.1 acyl-CoA dehydrogenase/oxidase [Aspergillus alliaceus]